tara:strand:+ start:4708 stop:5568 length:861 start_codon:yes stop_codon:yes gene_type:complete
MGSTKIAAPPPRDYYKETKDTLKAQIELAPQLFKAEASEEYGQPAYTGLALKTLRMGLQGDGNEPGMLSQYQNTIAPVLREVDAQNLRYQREQDVADVEALGQRASAAVEAADPKSKALGDELTRQVQSDLESEGRLSDRERRDVQQASRAAWGARGLAYSPGAGQSEAYITHMTQDAKRRANMQAASQLWAQRKAQASDPFMAILGRGSGVAAQGQSFMQGGQGLVQGAGPGLFNPESGYAQQMYNQQWQGQLAARTASAANKAAMWGAGIGALGKIGGSAFRPS